MREETVEDLIAEVHRAWTPDASIHRVAWAVWSRSMLDDGEHEALENVAFSILIEDGEPAQFPVGEAVMAMVRGGAHYDRTVLAPDERRRLAYLGFLAMAADTIGSEPPPA